MGMLTGLKSKNNREAYQFLLQLEQESEQSDGLYGCMDDFLILLQDSNSLVRTRGFRLICAQARWDKDGWLEKHLSEVLALLEDEKTTAVRQCLDALQQVIYHLPGLIPIIREKLYGLDLSKYSDSMIPLLQKDIDKLLNQMG